MILARILPALLLLLAAGPTWGTEAKRPTPNTSTSKPTTTSPHFSPGHGLRRSQVMRSGRKRSMSVVGLRSSTFSVAGTRLGATLRAPLSHRQGVSRRLPDVPHRAAQRSYPVGATATRRP